VKRIRAKPTKYCGVRFRSQLEAKYTTLFNMFDEPWTYESRFFKLPTANYLPDFFMPRLQIWIEVKGITPNAREVKLCEELSFKDERPVALAFGWPFCRVPYQPGLWVYANGVWHKNTYFAFKMDIQKLAICCPLLDFKTSWCEATNQCVAIGDDVIRSIDEKYRRQPRSKRTVQKRKS